MEVTRYTVSDGKLMLVLEPAEEGGYCVTSPLDPQLITQAETLEEAFENAYEVSELLIQARAEKVHAYLMGAASQPEAAVRQASESVISEASPTHQEGSASRAHGSRPPRRSHRDTSSDLA